MARYDNRMAKGDNAMQCAKVFAESEYVNISFVSLPSDGEAMGKPGTAENSPWSRLYCDHCEFTLMPTSPVTI